jgi:hypothetical protein
LVFRRIANEKLHGFAVIRHSFLQNLPFIRGQQKIDSMNEHQWNFTWRSGICRRSSLRPEGLDFDCTDGQCLVFQVEGRDAITPLSCVKPVTEGTL